MLINMAMANRI